MNVRMLIFGLSRGTDPQALRNLLGPARDAQLQLVDVDGCNDDAFAIVTLAAGGLKAWQLAQGIGSRRLGGRRLEAWITAMDWD